DASAHASIRISIRTSVVTENPDFVGIALLSLIPSTNAANNRESGRTIRQRLGRVNSNGRPAGVDYHGVRSMTTVTAAAAPQTMRRAPPRALVLPFACTIGLAALALLPSVRHNPRLMSAF